MIYGSCMGEHSTQKPQTLDAGQLDESAVLS